MDHLFVDTRLNVPYLVQTRYDAKGFHSFPARSGWKLADDGTWSKLGESVPGKHSKTDLEAFLQSWLFFGVLTEVLGPVNVTEFICEKSFASRYITTKTLPTHIKTWARDVRNSPRESRGRMLRASIVLSEAHALITKYCGMDGPHGQPLWDIDPAISLSFMILGESLSHAHFKIAKDANLVMNGWFEPATHHWGYSAKLSSLMRNDGWCPYALRILMGSLQQSASGQLYAWHLSHPRVPGLHHRECSEHDCHARQKGKHRGRHWEPDEVCECTNIYVDMETLTDILRRDKHPILRYSKGGQGIEVIEYDSEMTYGIISHVFADGFANEEFNCVRECHLNMFILAFSRILSSDQSLQFRDGANDLDAPIHFWVDALTIPVGDSYRSLRRKAIKDMHRMYRSAKFTVVFDAGLMCQPRGTTYSETAMQIATSYWMTRLWTLQEACLSRRLLFFFKDALADMDFLESEFTEDILTPIPAAAQRYYYALLGPERQKLKQNDQLLEDPQFLTAVWNAMKWRQTSNSHHEPQAIATLLGLDTDKFDDVDFNPSRRGEPADFLLDRKMKQLMEMISAVSDRAIPAGLIFTATPRLTTRGFAWAPASWLVPKGVDPRYLQPRQRSGQLTERGLRVAYPGFKLHKVCEPWPNGDTEREFSFPYDCNLKDWIVVKAEDLSKCAGPDIHQLAIVTEHLPARREPQDALIVSICETIGQSLRAQVLSRATIRAEVVTSRLRDLQSELRDNPSRSLLAEVLNDEQIWCIDGLETSHVRDQRGGAGEDLMDRSGLFRLFSSLQYRFSSQMTFF